MKRLILTLILTACTNPPLDGSYEARIRAEGRMCETACLNSPRWLCTTRGATSRCEVQLSVDGAGVGKLKYCRAMRAKYEQLKRSYRLVAGGCDPQ